MSRWTIKTAEEHSFALDIVSKMMEIDEKNNILQELVDCIVIYEEQNFSNTSNIQRKHLT